MCLPRAGLVGPTLSLSLTNPDPTMASIAELTGKQEEREAEKENIQEQLAQTRAARNAARSRIEDLMEEESALKGGPDYQGDSCLRSLDDFGGAVVGTVRDESGGELDASHPMFEAAKDLVTRYQERSQEIKEAHASRSEEVRAELAEERELEKELSESLGHWQGRLSQYADLFR